MTAALDRECPGDLGKNCDECSDISRTGAVLAEKAPDSGQKVVGVLQCPMIAPGYTAPVCTDMVSQNRPGEPCQAVAFLDHDTKRQGSRHSTERDLFPDQLDGIAILDDDGTENAEGRSSADPRLPRFVALPATEMQEAAQNHLIPFLRRLCSDGAAQRKRMTSARYEIPTGRLQI